LGCFQGKLTAHGCRDIDHLYPITFQSNFFNFLFNEFYSSSGLEITFQVMAVARQSARYQNAVCTIFQRLQYIDGINFAGARHLDNFNGGRIVQAHGAGQVCGSIRAVMTAKGNDLGVEFFFHVVWFILVRSG
jgi:hypothetical protein